MGFEPMRPEGLPVFKTGALSRTPPPLRGSGRDGAPSGPDKKYTLLTAASKEMPGRQSA
jgi:hypothetical protein